MKFSRRAIPEMATLQAFEAAARHGSFTRAAEELSLTQSAISRQIKDLETRLGVVLFERVRQRVILSDIGRRLLPEVRKLLGQGEELVARTLATAQASSSLTISALPTFGSRWLVPRLSRFVALHPDIVLTVGSHDEPFDLAEAGCDLAIHYGRPVWAHGVCSYLCSELIVPVASPAALAASRPTAPADLLDRPLLHLSTRPELWSNWLGMNGVEGPGAWRGHRLGQFAMVIEAATAGLGFALLPHYLIEPELSAGRLEIVFETSMATDNGYHVVLPETGRENALARAFQAWMIGEVRPETRLRA